ncbi:MAG TPA: hypothetical protein VER03_10285 [Bryobacteraceae bacterium]|nr:hypothetical protein [Bryobacteraceae bacterium]
MKRLKRAYDAANPGWVHHGNQQRVPANTISEEVRKQVVELASSKYAGLNDSHLQEKLAKAKGIVLSRPCVCRISREAGIRSPEKRRAAKSRSRRERRA